MDGLAWFMTFSHVPSESGMIWLRLFRSVSMAEDGEELRDCGSCMDVARFFYVGPNPSTSPLHSFKLFPLMLSFDQEL